MASIMDLLTSQLAGGTLKQISDQLGSDEQTTTNATGAALGTLIGALTRNAQRPDGAESLSRALAKDHDGSILANLESQIKNPSAGPGEGILRHVLGGRRGTVESGLSQATGLDSAKVGQLLTMLAPIVMGALGKAQRSGGMNARDLAGYLGKEHQQIEKREPQVGGMLGRLLDTDGDGDVDLSDLRRGGGLLGKLLGK